MSRLLLLNNSHAIIYYDARYIAVLTGHETAAIPRVTRRPGSLVSLTSLNRKKCVEFFNVKNFKRRVASRNRRSLMQQTRSIQVRVAGFDAVDYSQLIKREHCS